MRFKNRFGTLTVAVALAAASMGAARPAPARPADGAAQAVSSADSQVLDLQKKFQDACVAADGAALGRLMADDAIFIHGNAAVQSKSEFIAAITSGQLAVGQYDLHDPKVIMFQGGAIVSGLIDFGFRTPPGSTNPPRVLHMRGSSVWVQTPAGWRLVLDQDTPVQGPPPPAASH
jgi:ketosteroid isomerase-like protein